MIPRFGTTGDGILTGLLLMSQMGRTRSRWLPWLHRCGRCPQILINVPVADKATVAEAPAVRDAVARAQAELGDTGRILLRPRAPNRSCGSWWRRPTRTPHATWPVASPSRSATKADRRNRREPAGAPLRPIDMGTHRLTRTHFGSPPGASMRRPISWKAPFAII